MSFLECGRLSQVAGTVGLPEPLGEGTVGGIAGFDEEEEVT